jgi:hypothetical protein
MNKRPDSRERQSVAKAKVGYVDAEDGSWQQFIAGVANPELHTVVAFSLIGFLVALNLILRFPDMGAVIAQYNLF